MASDWKPWNGGNLRKENASVTVQVKWRNGRESREYLAGQLRWKWGDEQSDYDVIAYRKIAE